MSVTEAGRGEGSGESRRKLGAFVSINMHLEMCR